MKILKNEHEKLPTFLENTVLSFLCENKVSNPQLLVGMTIAAKIDYCNSIDIAGSTIAILLLLWTTIAILL